MVLYALNANTMEVIAIYETARAFNIDADEAPITADGERNYRKGEPIAFVLSEVGAFKMGEPVTGFKQNGCLGILGQII